MNAKAKIGIEINRNVCDANRAKPRWVTTLTFVLAFVTSLAVGGCGDIRDAVSEVPAEPDEEIQPEPEGQPDTQPDVAEPD
ncbi:MAG: hypothetical protein GY822_13800, partial [Deltaproteobacteria bacterium]|nr:hypothetical protein [Deltaproteobacteria bacterium]